MNVSIQSFDVVYQEQVQNLVLGIQNDEFNLGVTIDKQPDLPNIKAFFQDSGGAFWVGLTDEKKVVACIGIQYLDEKDAVLRKMFLDKSVRGDKDLNLAQRLCNKVIEHAKERKIQALWLDTPPPAHAAHRFYERNGFVEVDMNLLPSAYRLPKIIGLKLYRMGL